MGSGYSWKVCSRAQLCASVSSLSSDSTCWRSYSLSTACNKCCRLPLHPLCETLIQYPTVGHDCSRQHCCTGHSHANLTPVHYLIPLMLMLRIWEGSSDTLWSLTEAQRKLIIWESVPWVAIWLWLNWKSEAYNECDDSNECVAMQCTYSLHHITRLSLNKSISLETWWTYLVCPTTLAAFQFPFLSLLSLLIAESSFFSLSLSLFSSMLCFYQLFHFTFIFSALLSP